MPADSLHCMISARELDSLLRGGRIDKITMPEPDEIILHVHSRANYACVLSANPSLPRIHVTKYAPRTNPLVAPAFLMHLRKHIGGATVNGVRCHCGERIILFSLTARNELGYEEKKTLICEILGKYANIILCDGESRISECIKHISPAGSEKRPVLPGLIYSFPPAQNKADLYDGEQVRALLDTFTGGNLASFILTGGAGLAPATITATVARTLGKTNLETLSATQKDELVSAFGKLVEANELRPCVRTQGGKSDFWAYPYHTDGEYKFFDTLNEAMDEYFFALDRDRRLAEKSHVPKTVVKNALARAEKKLKLFSERKAEASDLERDKLYGELITANIYRLKQGMKAFEADNYYTDPPEKITIPLQENKSPQFNAQAYYKRYAKKKKTLSMVEEQLAQAQADIEYLSSVYDSFAYTDSEGLEEIIAELTDLGLIREQKDKRKKKAVQSHGGEITYEGCNIRWGKTNLQNDRVTKEAKPDDVWLHTQKIHGSHVTVSGAQITERVIERAASVAAYYSKARLADKVPVDYTLRKYVSKPKGSPPGKVIYTDYKTIFVTPKDERE